MKRLYGVICILVLGIFSISAQAVDRAITWIAVGDDGFEGTATQYDLRLSAVPITAENWDKALQLENEPLPQPAGSVETYVLDGLEPGEVYYVALKVADESPNWSPISNVLVMLAVPAVADTIPPAAVTTLDVQE